MNRDQIVRALRQPGPRERGYVQEALPATAADLRARLPRRNRMLMSAGAFGGLAAAVAGGAVIAVVLSQGFNPSPGTSNGGTVSSPSPTPTATPTPTPSPAPIGACRAGDFAWSSDAWGAAAGSRGTTIVAQGVTSLTRCDLRGQATLTLRDANGAILITGHTAKTNTRVSAGKVFEVGVMWSNWCAAAPAQPISFALTLPGDTTEVPLIPPGGGAISVPPCNGPAPSNLGATDFQPSNRPPPAG
jgi:hypothetical protein